MVFVWRSDERDVRDRLRLDVIDLSAKLGPERVPPGLLDDAMDIWRRSGMRAARAHIAKAERLVSPST